MKTNYCHRIVIVLFFFLQTACGSEAGNEIAEIAPRPAKIIEIGGANIERSNRYPATIEASDLSELSFQVGGRIAELPVKQAQSVAKGDLIARLDQGDFQSNLASARALFQNAESNFQRGETLAQRSVIAKSELDQLRSKRDVARADFDSAKKALSDSTLYAPFSGVVAQVPVRQLQTVAAGTKVATVIGTTYMEAVVNLPASVMSQTPRPVDPGALVLLDSAPKQEIKATYKEANLVADNSSQTYSVTFVFAQPDNMVVLPGMNATLVLQSTNNGSDGTGAVTVPLAVVQSESGGQYVWVVDPSSMTVSRRDIEIEPGIGDLVLVTKGLKKGEQIIGAGGAYLTEGEQITRWTQ